VRAEGRCDAIDRKAGPGGQRTIARWRACLALHMFSTEDAPEALTGQTAHVLDLIGRLSSPSATKCLGDKLWHRADEFDCHGGCTSTAEPQQHADSSPYTITSIISNVNTSSHISLQTNGKLGMGDDIRLIVGLANECHLPRYVLACGQSLPLHVNKPTVHVSRCFAPRIDR